MKQFQQPRVTRGAQLLPDSRRVPSFSLRPSPKPGSMLVYRRDVLSGPRYIINFPTKRHWKGDSRIEDIEAGLKALTKVVQELQIKTIAGAPAWCGLGGLTWPEVRSRIEHALNADDRFLRGSGIPRAISTLLSIFAVRDRVRRHDRFGARSGHSSPRSLQHHQGIAWRTQPRPHTCLLRRQDIDVRAHG